MLPPTAGTLKSRSRGRILIFDRVAVKPNAEALWFQHRSYTYDQMNKISNRFFHFSRDTLGLKPNDMVAMLFQNCPEFLFTQVGLAKLKCPEAWMNYNLRGASFLGCLDIADPKVLVFETAMAGHILETLDKLISRPNPIKIVLWDNEGGAATIVPQIEAKGGKVAVVTEQSLRAYSDAEPDVRIRRDGTTVDDVMCLICGCARERNDQKWRNVLGLINSR